MHFTHARTHMHKEGDKILHLPKALLTFGTKRMDLKVTSPSAVKWLCASGSSWS